MTRRGHSKGISFAWRTGFFAASVRRGAAVASILVAGLVLALVGWASVALGLRVSSAQCSGASHSSILLSGGIKPDGLETNWSFVYSTSPSGPWVDVPGGQGKITRAEAEKLPEEDSIPVRGELTGTPEVTYYVFLTATNTSDEVREEVKSSLTRGFGCETLPLYVTPSVRDVENVTATSAEVAGLVNPNGNFAEIDWHYEYVTAKDLEEAGARKEEAKWVDGPSGVISKEEAEGVSAGDPFVSVNGELTG